MSGVQSTMNQVQSIATILGSFKSIKLGGCTIRHGGQVVRRIKHQSIESTKEIKLTKNFN